MSQNASPSISFTRAIAFQMSPIGGEHKLCVVPFETEADKLALVETLMHSPGELSVFFMFSPERCRLQMSNAPPGSYREALLFVSQLYPGSSLATAPDVPDYPDPVVTHDEEDDLSFDEQTTKSMTFEVGSREAKLALARWIETKLFVPFLDSTATCYFTGVIIVSDASTQGSGTATPADGAAVDEEDSDEEEDLAPSPPAPRRSAAGALRHMQEELEEVQYDLCDGVYLRLTNALKRTHDELS